MILYGYGCQKGNGTWGAAETETEIEINTVVTIYAETHLGKKLIDI